MGNSIAPHVAAAQETTDSLNTDESSTIEASVSAVHSYDYCRGIFKYKNKSSNDDCLKYTVDSILSVCRYEQWFSIRTLNLRRQRLTGVYDLTAIVPSLEHLILSDNFIQEMSGLPRTIRTLKINRNRLTDISGIIPLVNLQYLDVCNNAISSFKDVGTLHELKVIHAENNKLKSCQFFQIMRGLEKLNLRNNRLEDLIFGDSTQLDNLEILDVSYNRISHLESIERLTELRVLNLEHNDLYFISVNEPMVKLKALYLSFNCLTVLNGSFFPDLRTLQLDDNHISRLLSMNSIPRLSEISVRNQCCQLTDFDLQSFAGVRTLLLAGNVLQRMHTLVDFGALEYLELCSTQLESLPCDFSQQAPNITVLCLGHNHLYSIKPLRKLHKLEKLVMVNNRLKRVNDLVKNLRSMKALRYLDFRDNPITFRYYPTTMPDRESRKNPCQCTVQTQSTDWGQKVDEYLQTIPPIWLQRRHTYRAVLLKACSNLAVMDGIPISSEEKSLAHTIVFRNYQQHQA
ncbi:unnamed protein product [Absidia cylindrospora]